MSPGRRSSSTDSSGATGFVTWTITRRPPDSSAALTARRKGPRPDSRDDNFAHSFECSGTGASRIHQGRHATRRANRIRLNSQVRGADETVRMLINQPGDDELASKVDDLIGVRGQVSSHLD